MTAIAKKKNRTFLVMSAVCQTSKMRKMNIRRKVKGEYHDLIQEMRLLDPERHFTQAWMALR